MASSVEQEHMDVLQNLEYAILGIYREHPELTDYQVDSAMEALGRSYVRTGTPTLPKSELSRQVYNAVRMMCEWRLGYEQLVDEGGQPMSIEPISVDVLLACLKRLRKSVRLWNKEGGSQGYLHYINQFLP